jgi:hypothetical protein
LLPRCPLLAGLALALALPPALPAADAPGLLSRTAELMAACLDDYNRLDLSRSEAEAREAMALQPQHPLPLVHLQGCLVSLAYEQSQAGRIDPGLLRCFQQASDQADAVESAWEAAYHDGWAQLYIGNSLGAQGLLALYQGRSIRAYQLGRRAEAALQLAQRRSPGLADADLGLGQYLYYCGRMAGLLRFFLDLPGDIPGGIARLKACAASDCRSAVLARLVLARILVEEESDPEAALPYVQEAFQRYPLNWSFAKLAQEEALKLGLARPPALGLALALRRQWDAGWRPPAYAKLDPVPLFKALDGAAPPASSQQGQHPQAQRLRLQRLGQDAGAGVLLQLHPRILRRGGHHQHRLAAQQAVAPQQLQEAGPVHAGHVQVADDQVHGPAAQQAQGGLPVGGLQQFGLGSQAPEQMAQPDARGGRILDHQHP